MPSPALVSYLVLQRELTEVISEKWTANSLSINDIAQIACEFFAIKAGGMVLNGEILEN